MSADNWTICPRCFAKARAEEERERDAVMALYGKIPADEFDERRGALTPVNPDDYQTFREDYEVSGASEGELEAYYSGRCTTCDLYHHFEHTERFWGPGT